MDIYGKKMREGIAFLVFQLLFLFLPFPPIFSIFGSSSYIRVHTLCMYEQLDLQLFYWSNSSFPSDPSLAFSLALSLSLSLSLTHFHCFIAEGGLKKEIGTPIEFVRERERERERDKAIVVGHLLVVLLLLVFAWFSFRDLE